MSAPRAVAAACRARSAVALRGLGDGAGQARPIRRGRSAQDSIGEQADRQQHACVARRAGAIVRTRVHADDRIRDLGQRIVGASADRDARQLGAQLHHLGDLAALARCRQGNEGLRRGIEGVVEICRAIGRGPSPPGPHEDGGGDAPPGSWRRCRRSRSTCPESRRGRARPAPWSPTAGPLRGFPAAGRPRRGSRSAA